MAGRRRASCPCPGESPPQFETVHSRLVENAQRRYSYNPGDPTHTLPSTGTYTREMRQVSTPPNRGGAPPRQSICAAPRKQQPITSRLRQPGARQNARALIREFQTPEQTCPAQQQSRPQVSTPRNRRAPSPQRLCGAPRKQQPFASRLGQQAASQNVRVLDHEFDRYSPQTCQDPQPQLVSTPPNARPLTPERLCTTPRKQARPAPCRGRQKPTRKLNVRVLSREFEQIVPQTGQEQRQPCFDNFFSIRRRSDAASTVDDFRSQREINQYQQEGQMQQPICPGVGPPLLTSTPTEAYLATMARVGPPLERDLFSMASVSPIPRVNAMNQTVAQVRDCQQASGRRELFEADNVSRQQRQVAFDVPPGKEKSRKEKKEAALSPLKRFDRDATAELKKCRQMATERGMTVLRETGGYEATRQRQRERQPRSTISMSAKSSMSAREIGWLLREEPDTELIDAVEKLAQAEAAVVYDGAVRAAEEAAAKAPPELAEEAAAAGARTYRAEITHSVQEVLTGEKPIEIIAYVGMTRPREV